MNSLSEKIGILQAILIARATGGAVAEDMEQQYRLCEIINHPNLKDVAPKFLKSCRTTEEFWPIAKAESSTCAGRRKFI